MNHDYLESSSAAEFNLVTWVRSLHPDIPEIADELTDAIKDSPGRISRAFQELFSGYLEDPANVIKAAVALDRNLDYDGLVSSQMIPFMSVCPHHFLPYFGNVEITYQPGGMLIGVGKLPRVVDVRARRLQLQEFLVRDLCHDLMTHGEARGVYAVASATHLCICGRGPKKESVVTVSSFAAGTLVGMKDSLHQST